MERKGGSQLRQLKNVTKYSVEVGCSRCGDDFIKEVREGEPISPRRRWKGDVSGMCNPCKSLITFGMCVAGAAIILPIVAVIVIFS